MTHIFLVLLCFTWSFNSFANDLIIGQIAPKFKLAGENGGRLNGEPWTSEELVGSRITSFFYIDPEERAKNEPIEAAYKKANFPTDKHHGVAVLNMAAAWYPNSILNSQLEKKQKEFPNTDYLKDYKKAFVSAWSLKDDSVNFAIFDRDGKVLFVKKGPLSEKEIEEAMQIIRSKL